MKTIHALTALLLLAPATAAFAAEAPCCASGDNGKPAGRNAIAVTSLNSSDLGKVGTTASNVSLASDYQVYRFTRNSVAYTEVADAAGTPRAAFAIVNGALLTLPVGQDNVQQIAIAPTGTDVVYTDATVSVAKYTATDGSVTWQVYIK